MSFAEFSQFQETFAILQITTLTLKPLFRKIMLQFFFISVLLFNKDALAQECEADDKYPWSYRGPNNNPSFWEKDYPVCGQKEQSPIEISEKDITDSQEEKLDYKGFDTPVTKATVQNRGWTVMVIPEDGVKRTIQLDTIIFNLEEIHFHFGTTSNPGAEHVLEGKRYEMEIHYVAHPEDDPDFGCVVASLIRATDKNNDAMDAITEVLSNVQYRNDSTKLKSQLDLSSLLPSNGRSYYLYFGRNASPPCEGGYAWLVLQDIGEIGNDQLDEFMTLYSVGEKDASDSCRMGPNYRPTQDLGDRFIFKSK